MVPYVKRLIKKENIKTVIATGAPFTVNYAAALIKKSCPFIQLIQDFRDPWNDDKLYVPKFGSEKRKKKSLDMELFSLNKADKIVSVTNMFSNDYSLKTDKNVLTIYNGFNDYNKTVKDKKESNTIKIIYAGSLNCGRQDCLEYLLDNMNNVDNVVIDLYTEKNNKILNKYSNLINKGIVNFKEKISYEKLLERIIDYNFGLHLNAEAYPGALSTKIYDYLSRQVPLLSINYGGEIEDFIRNNNFGYSANILEDNIMKIMKKMKNDEIKISYDNIKKYSYEENINNYIKIIENEN